MLILLVDFLYFPGWWEWWESREGASSLGVWASVVTGMARKVLTGKEKIGKSLHEARRGALLTPTEEAGARRRCGRCLCGAFQEQQGDEQGWGAVCEAPNTGR